MPYAGKSVSAWGRTAWGWKSAKYKRRKPITGGREEKYNHAVRKQRQAMTFGETRDENFYRTRRQQMKGNQ